MKTRLLHAHVLAETHVWVRRGLSMYVVVTEWCPAPLPAVRAYHRGPPSVSVAACSPALTSTCWRARRLPVCSCPSAGTIPGCYDATCVRGAELGSAGARCTRRRRGEPARLVLIAIARRDTAACAAPGRLTPHPCSDNAMARWCPRWCGGGQRGQRGRGTCGQRTRWIHGQICAFRNVQTFYQRTGSAGTCHCEDVTVKIGSSAGAYACKTDGLHSAARCNAILWTSWPPEDPYAIVRRDRPEVWTDTHHKSQ